MLKTIQKRNPEKSLQEGTQIKLFFAVFMIAKENMITNGKVNHRSVNSKIETRNVSGKLISI